MTGKLLHHLSPNQSIDVCLQVRRVRGRAGRDGRRYLVLTLSDGVRDYRAFAHPDTGLVQVGQTVRVCGRTRSSHGEVEVLARSVSPVEPATTAGSASGPVPAETALARLTALVAEIGPPYRAVVECILADAAFRDRLARVPASLTYHHAYVGGLLHHTVEVMEAGLRLLPLLPAAIDRDLLLTATFCHDLGKADTYTDVPPYALTPLGRALGHEWLGLKRLFRAVESPSAVPPEACSRLLTTLTGLPAHDGAPIPPEREVLRALDGLSVCLSRAELSGPGSRLGLSNPPRDWAPPSLAA